MGGQEYTQVAVVGGGPGGYAAAFLAADLGLEVSLVDPRPDPGGVCLFEGCIPSKTLLHASGLIGLGREASEVGVTFQPPRVDLARLREHAEQVVARLTGGLGQLARRRRVRHIRGRARLADGRSLQIEADEGPDRLGFEHAILATGSVAARLPDQPRAERIMDAAAALSLPEVPDRLLVVGGGYIGLELGSVYARLGSRVSLVEATERLLPGVDADLVKPLAKRVDRSFERIQLNTPVRRLEPEGDIVRVELGAGQDAGVAVFDRVLVAIGRRPATADLGLERTEVRLDRRGFVQVDSARRTAEPRIYAIGDLTGEPMLAHVASHEGRVAAEAIAGRRVAFEPRAVPAVVFTDPEIAWCGLTETAARAAGRDVDVARFPWAASGRAVTLGRPDGLTKIITDPMSGRLVGVGIAGAGAGELIAEGVLAVELGATPEDLLLSIHPHPTLSETLMEAAGVHDGTATHLHRPRSQKAR